MASGDKTNPRVYLFKDDCDMILELVRCRPTRSTGGDLFGLWTNDREPVLHIVTGQGRETVSSLFSSNNASDDSRIKDLGARLRDKFRLSYLGKWQYMPRSEPTEAEIMAKVDQNTLFKGTGMKYFLLILASCDDQSSKVELNPYFLSRFSTTTRGEIADVLPSSSIFKEDDDIASIIDSLIDRKGAMKGEKFTDKDDQCEDTDHAERQPCCDLAVPEFNRFETGFACNPRELKVYLFPEDCEMMKDLVLRYPNVETGGDLFGLWTSDGDAVLHMVLGPGKNCKRTATSFYQDIPYLQEKGELLTTKYMLCHIGEWHSHHQLHLYEPSHGDSSTVIRHYPHGTCGFLLIIANILSPDTVHLSPYLYTARSQYDFYQKGQLVPLPSRNAFKKATEIARTISEGQETWSNFQSGMNQYSPYNRLPQMPRTSDQFNARGISEGRGQGSNFQTGMAQYSQHPCIPQIAEAYSQSTESRMESSNDNNDELMELD